MISHQVRGVSLKTWWCFRENSLQQSIGELTEQHALQSINLAQIQFCVGSHVHTEKQARRQSEIPFRYRYPSSEIQKRHFPLIILIPTNTKQDLVGSVFDYGVEYRAQQAELK